MFNLVSVKLFIDKEVFFLIRFYLNEIKQFYHSKICLRCNNCYYQLKEEKGINHFFSGD